MGCAIRILSSPRALLSFFCPRAGPGFDKLLETG
jgi:hypothetical protein